MWGPVSTIYFDQRTGWITKRTYNTSMQTVNLCWIPLVQRGYCHAVHRGFKIAIGARRGPVTIISLWPVLNS
jgi:hypothetical protein